MPADCNLRLLAVDNARETVHKDNRISGMLAASHPPRLLSGLWYRPAPMVFLRPVSGLVGVHGQANYAAAKAGVIGLTRSVAKELARRQVTVNAVAPGVVRTTMIGDIKPELMTEYLKQIPVGRLAEPADVANVVLFLASAEAGYVTGQTLHVNGGMAML